ncbi:hypothetical protein ACFX2C_028405 [Malus domestica]
MADEINELPCCVDVEAGDEDEVGLGRVRRLRNLAVQGCCICWIIEGPRCLIETFISEPWQPGHFIEAPDFDLLPLHLEQILLRARENFLDASL